MCFHDPFALEYTTTFSPPPPLPPRHPTPTPSSVVPHLPPAAPDLGRPRSPMRGSRECFGLAPPVL